MKNRRKARGIEDVRLEGFVPVSTEAVQTGRRPQPSRQRPALEVELEARLVNWCAAVRNGRENGNVCASWAKAYYAAQREREEQLAIALQITRPASPLFRATADELDGWLVEAAARSIGHADQQRLLRLKYIWGYGGHFLKTKLGVNDSDLRILLGRALTNLKNALDKLDAPDKIRSNNLHARSVPRPEAFPVAVPLGTTLPEETFTAQLERLLASEPEC